MEYGYQLCCLDSDARTVNPKAGAFAKDGFKGPDAKPLDRNSASLETSIARERNDGIVCSFCTVRYGQN
jgi:hypothetical protein